MSLMYIKRLLGKGYFTSRPFRIVWIWKIILFPTILITLSLALLVKREFLNDWLFVKNSIFHRFRFIFHWLYFSTRLLNVLQQFGNEPHCVLSPKRFKENFSSPWSLQKPNFYQHSEYFLKFWSIDTFGRLLALLWTLHYLIDNK